MHGREMHGHACTQSRAAESARRPTENHTAPMPQFRGPTSPLSGPFHPICDTYVQITGSLEPAPTLSSPNPTVWPVPVITPAGAGSFAARTDTASNSNTDSITRILSVRLSRSRMYSDLVSLSESSFAQPALPARISLCSHLLS